MKTPVYESSPGALSTLLLSKNFAYWDCYSVALATVNETDLFTTCDIDIKIPSGVAAGTYTAKGPMFDQDNTKTQMHLKTGMDIDTWQVAIQYRTTGASPNVTYPDLVGGLPWPQAAALGLLDGATVTVYRAYFNKGVGPVGPISPVGVIIAFLGRVGQVDPGMSMCVLSIDSHMSLLDIQNPVELFGPNCPFTLFSPTIGIGACKLNPDTYQTTGTILSGSTASVINVNTGLPPSPAPQRWDLGKLQFTSGQNNNFRRAIRTSSGGSGNWALTLIRPLPFVPQVGDTLNIWPGCDKTVGGNGCGGYNNLTNFGGDPWVPNPEVAAS